MKTKPADNSRRTAESRPEPAPLQLVLDEGQDPVLGLVAGLQPLEARRSVPCWVKHHHAGWGCQPEG